MEFRCTGKRRGSSGQPDAHVSIWRKAAVVRGCSTAKRRGAADRPRATSLPSYRKSLRASSPRRHASTQCQVRLNRLLALRHTLTSRCSDSALPHARSNAAPAGADCPSTSTRADALLAAASLSGVPAFVDPAVGAAAPTAWRVGVRQFVSLLRTRWLLKVRKRTRSCERARWRGALTKPPVSASEQGAVAQTRRANKPVRTAPWLAPNAS